MQNPYSIFFVFVFSSLCVFIFSLYYHHFSLYVHVCLYVAEIKRRKIRYINIQYQTNIKKIELEQEEDRILLGNWITSIEYQNFVFFYGIPYLFFCFYFGSFKEYSFACEASFWKQFWVVEIVIKVKKIFSPSANLCNRYLLVYFFMFSLWQ